VVVDGSCKEDVSKPYKNAFMKPFGGRILEP